MGADELARYFPDRNVALFVATWNMQGQKVSGLSTPTQDGAGFPPGSSWGSPSLPVPRRGLLSITPSRPPLHRLVGH